MHNDINKLLKTIFQNGSYASHKDIPESERKMADKLISYNLLRKEGTSYKLTREGYEAIEIGDFETWKVKSSQNNTKTIIENYSNSNVIRNSAIQESKVQLDSHSSKKNKITPIIQSPQKQNNRFISNILKYLLIPFIWILIELFTEYGIFQKVFNVE